MTSTEDRPEALLKEGVFALRLESGGGLVAFPDGRQAYAQPQLVRRMALEARDTVRCTLVPNFPQQATDQVPWRVIYATVLGRQDGEVPKEAEVPVTECLGFLSNNPGAWTVPEMAHECGLSCAAVRAATAELYRTNRVARSVVSSRSGGGNEDHEFFYSLRVEDLIPTGALEDDD